MLKSIADVIPHHRRAPKRSLLAESRAETATTKTTLPLLIAPVISYVCVLARTTCLSVILNSMPQFVWTVPSKRRICVLRHQTGYASIFRLYTLFGRNFVYAPDLKTQFFDFVQFHSHPLMNHWTTKKNFACANFISVFSILISGHRMT